MFDFSDIGEAEIVRVHGPSVIGENEDGLVDPRHATRKIGSVTIEIPATAEDIEVALFESLDDEDRGGIVIRIEVAGGGSGWMPHAKKLPRGIELHMAGDGESKALLTALASLIAMRRSNRGRLGRVVILEDGDE